MLFYLRVDEIFLKGNNQKLFFNTLKENLKKLLHPKTVKRIEGGLLLDVEEQKINQLELIPGIAKISPVIVCKNEIKEIIKTAKKVFQNYSGKTFAVETIRSYKKFSFRSQEINEKVGSALNKEFGLKVKLDSPDIKISIFIAKDETYICGNTFEGIGGLPTGTSGKVLCLLSGGIDSPVAAYTMMKRGAQVDFIHFQNQTEVTQEVSEKIFDLVKKLCDYQVESKLFMVLFADWQKQIIMKIPADYRMLITRRLMFKISALVAEKQKYLGLVTGDSLGQVASQTLENLNAVYAGVDILKLSPLLGSNKVEVIKLARKIGTLEISNRPYEDCCSLFVAPHPQTKAKKDKLVELENYLDLSTLDKTKILSYNISMI